MKKTLVLFVSALVISGAAQAQAPASAPSASDTRSDPNRVICRTEMEMGSLTKRKKTCMTQAQWKDMTARSALDIEKRQDLRSVTGG
ncbi:hypothetical protein [Novosphingobium olei]|uniref:PsiF repeat-containing protein n=1 Tax=Novosphingobium olei TaxID=2728851 RepID=A0A7Y0BQS0_9SPHN|nr:hypothetical protein [Novosphingobium olei]NML94570.1 hypothetical protein [Novosphingobium olei]